MNTMTDNYLTPDALAVIERAKALAPKLEFEERPYGYRYAAHDPHTDQPWPAMPDCMLELAQGAALEAGYANFQPEACLINQYVPGAKLSLHQDKDEKDLSAPIVSVSLGLSAVFLLGTPVRKDRPQRYRLVHGDVVVWGGQSRLSLTT